MSRLTPEDAGVVERIVSSSFARSNRPTMKPANVTAPIYHRTVRHTLEVNRHGDKDSFLCVIVPPPGIWQYSNEAVVPRRHGHHGALRSGCLYLITRNSIKDRRSFERDTLLAPYSWNPVDPQDAGMLLKQGAR